MIQKDKYYIFFDGDCGFCNFWVQWILKNDKKNTFIFAALQSDFGQNFLKERNLEHKDFNTIYLWKPGSFFEIKSDAILTTTKLLGGFYQLLNLFRHLPKPFRNACYDIIAKYRKTIMPQSCLLPTEEQRKKMII